MMPRPAWYPVKHRGFTLIELVVTIAIAAIPLAAVAVLLSGASRSWQKIYNDANSRTRQDSLAIMASIQSFGRRANITNYQVYTIKNSVFTVAAVPSGQTAASGQAIEFRYWDELFDPGKNNDDLLESTNTGTHYALFYLDGINLKLDLGKVVNNIGAVKNSSRQTSQLLSTQTLTSFVNLTESPSPFSHTFNGGVGSGCINTDLTLTDAKNLSIEIKFATLLRSAWPR